MFDTIITNCSLFLKPAARVIIRKMLKRGHPSVNVQLLAQKTRLFLLDMDGTVYLGRRWIAGAREFLDRVQATGRQYAFVTNNSTKGTTAYVEKLAGMGLAVEPRQIIISSHAAADYLTRRLPGRRVFVLGTDQLRQELAGRGVSVCQDRTADAAVVSFDTSLCYADLCVICDLVRAGVPYIATHPDRNCPTETGFIPDAGANIAYIEASTGRLPDAVLGKPQPGLIEYGMRAFGVPRGHTAMLGDRLYTDVKSGLNAGVTAVLVLSGETKREDLENSGIVPDLVLDSVADITPYL